MITFKDIEQEFRIVTNKYPALNKLNEKKYGYCISGGLSIIDSNAYEWGCYEIEICIPNSYPSDLPLLLEKGRLIERHIDWHISNEGICCVGTPARQYRDMADGVSLIKWIGLFVIPYLANHAYKKDIKEYADGELAHGEKGIFQDYAFCFGLKEPIEIILRR